ncbi:MAG: hypothetical protein ACOX36_07420 [Saccharofermentanales bacterium]|jgi:uncharacterized membrane protein
MLFRLILWLSLSWIPILMYFMHRNETKFKKNIVVEVTLPFEARTDANVMRLLERFKQQILWINLVLFLVTIPFLFIDKISLLMTAWMTWLLFVVLLPMVPYVRTNMALKRMKLERGWKKTRKPIQYVDLAALPPAKWISHWVFILAIVISFMPLLWDREMIFLYLVFGFSTIFFWLGYRYLYRNKSEMVDQNVNLTRVLTQVRRYNWGIVWLVSAYGFAAMSLIFSLLKYHLILQLVSTLLIVFIITVVAIRAEFRTRRVQARLTAESGKDWYVDDDDYWIGGVVYYNPNDSRLLINSRVGVNSTINLAKTSGKVLAVLIALLLLAMPFTGVFLKQTESQPISIELTDRMLVAHLGRKSEMLELSKITDVTILTELPERMTRNWGTAMDKLMSGSYYIKGIGSTKLSLDPTVPPFLLVCLEDGSRYLIGSRHPGEVEAVYQQLKLQE